MDTTRSKKEDNVCDLARDLVRYTGPVVFEKGEQVSVIIIEIKHDELEEGTEFFNLRIGSIHRRLKRSPSGADSTKMPIDVAELGVTEPGGQTNIPKYKTLPNT